MSPRLSSGNFRVVLVSAALAVLILAAFEPVRYNEFVKYDDPDYVTENPYIQSGFTAQSVKWAFTSGYAANWHPLTWLSHMVDIELFGLNPLGHHLHNLGLHLAATLLLFWVLQSMTGALWRSAFVAMVFGVHPLHVESVAWAAERKDLLCAFFWMLTIAMYLSYARRGGGFRYLLVVLCFALGLMAKPMILTLPAVLMALDVWPLGRLSAQDGEHSPPSISRLIIEKVPLFGLSLASAVITFLVQQKGGAVAELDMGLAYRLWNALVSYAGYLGKMIWPLHLAVIYPLPPDGWPAWKPIGSLVLLVLGTWFIVRQVKRRPYLPVGWAWYLVTLVPVIGLVQVGSQAMADRYTYLPSVGILVMLAWGAADLSAAWQRRKTVMIVLNVTLALAMLAATRAQVSHWKDSASLYRHTLSVTRDNYIAHRYFATILEEQGRIDEAEEHYRESIRIYKGFAEAHLGLGQILDAQGKYGDALLFYLEAMRLAPGDSEAFYKTGAMRARQGLMEEAAGYLRQSIRLNGDFAKAHLDLGQVLTAQKKYDEAMECYERAIRLDPGDSRALYYAGVVKTQQRAWNEAADYFHRSIGIDSGLAEAYLGLGIVLQHQGRIEEAVAQFRSTLKIKPDDCTAWTNLGDCLHLQKKPQEAIDSYERVVKLRPREISLHYKLAQVLKEQGRVSEAVSHHRSALEIKPDFAPSLNNLAWILATTQDSRIRNPAEAVRLAEKICGLTSFGDHNCLDTLAAAYAGAGQFNKAIETAERAIGLAKAANQTDVVQDISQKLQLYQTGQVYLEP